MKQFERLTDAEQMKTLLQAQLPGFCEGDLLIRQCEILHTRYRTYTNAAQKHKSWLGVCYRLAVEAPGCEAQGEQILYARACLNGRSQLEYQQALSAPLAPPQFGEALAHLPELDMTVWAFPNDPQLPHLPEMIDPQRLKRHLPYAALPAGFQTPQEVAAIESSVVHYYPEERCTTRYHLRNRRSQTLALYGKTYKNGGGRTIYERARQLWEGAKTQPGGFKIAEPVAYDETAHTFWQKHQPGQPLLQNIAGRDGRELLRAVAEGLALFHQSTLTSPVHQTVETHLLDIGEKFKKLIHAFPQFRDSLQSLIHNLETSASSLPPVAESLIHGDFHIRQLLAHQGHIFIFDFDEFALGDPAQDVANFIADLYFSGLEPEWVEGAAATFYRTYQARQSIPPERFRWHLRFRFMTKAYRRYRQQAPGLNEDIQRAIALAQRAARFFDPPFIPPFARTSAPIGG